LVQGTCYCGARFWYWRSSEQEYCSSSCANLEQRAQIARPAEDTLARFVYDRWRESWREAGPYLAPFARKLGVSTEGLKRLLTGAHPSRLTLAKVVAAFGAHYDVPLDTTEIERRRAQIEPFRVTARPIDAEYRAWRRLVSRLRGNRRPSRADLDKWSSEYGERVGMPARAIMAMWRDELQERGLLGRGGPKPNEDRHDRIDQWKMEWTRLPSKPKGGFWSWAAARETKLMQDEDADSPGIDGPSLCEWNRRHTKTPGRCQRARADRMAG
jgi:hypothetical protein